MSVFSPVFGSEKADDSLQTFCKVPRQCRSDGGARSLCELSEYSDGLLDALRRKVDFLSCRETAEAEPDRRECTFASEAESQQDMRRFEVGVVSVS